MSASVDDGTAVVDCNQKFPRAAVSNSPTKRGMKKKDGNNMDNTLLPIIPPLIGDLVIVVGRPVKWHDSRQLKVETLGNPVSILGCDDADILLCQISATTSMKSLEIG